MIRHSVQRLELRRSPAAFRLEHDLSFDPLLWRHYGAVTRVLHEFRPDVIHVTGPSDVGQLGALLGHRMHVPMVFSWHTNLHQYRGAPLVEMVPLAAADCTRTAARRGGAPGA